MNDETKTPDTKTPDTKPRRVLSGRKAIRVLPEDTTRPDREF